MTQSYTVPNSVSISGEYSAAFAEILTPQAITFIAKLQREFNARRLELLARRNAVQAEIESGNLPAFPNDSRGIRGGDWQVAPTPDDLQKRWVEITGPTDRKMLINALNSGANIFMADMEDANSPTWFNMVDGQTNLRDAVNRTISLETPEGKSYALNDEVAVLMVRPRGWHLEEKHITVDGAPMSGSLMDFGLYFFHNAKNLLDRGSGPYFYLPKLESHLEARLWNDVFILAQDELGIPRGSIRATMLLETILAAFEMEEMLYELREHSAGLNAGRWDYIFSVIKKFRNVPGFLLPDRSQIGMTVPFMRAYTELLVKSCHTHGAHAIGGMAAFIPSRRDAEVNDMALKKVREDKERESADGFDGTWVAHPDLVPVAREVFEKVLGDKPHQKERTRDEVQVQPADLMQFDIAGGQITEEGLRNNISVALIYLEAWLRGLGAVAIYNLMEDTATAEISRAQVWQWIHNDAAQLADGRAITTDLYQSMVPEELDKIKDLFGDELYAAGKFDVAQKLFDDLCINDDFPLFLTLGAYDKLE
jgi:malate synthase